MPVKSIVDIDVNDAAFKRFNDLFAQYQAKLKESPSIWAKLSKTNAETADVMDRMTAALLAQRKIQDEIEESDDKQNKTLSKTEGLWKSISSSSGALVSNVLSVTKSIIKWGGLLGTAAAFGSMFGIDRIARDASDLRRNSLGLGMSSGGLQSFNTNFSRLIDTDSFLGWVNGMETDVSKQAPAYALLHRGLTGNTDNDSVSLLRAARSLAQRTPTNQLGPMLNAYGLNLSPEEQRRLKGSDSEFNQLLGSYRKDKTGLGMDDATLKKWQDLTTQIDRAKQSIFKVFVEGLAPLTSPLQNLSQSVVHLFQHMEQNGTIQKGIDNLSKWIDGLGKATDKPDFLKNIDMFVDDIGVVARKVHSALVDLGWVTPDTKPAQAAAAAQTISKPGWWQRAITGASNFLHADLAGPAVYEQMAATLDKSGGLPRGLIEFQKHHESGDRWTGVPRGAAGEIGIGQFKPDTAAALGVDPNDPISSLHGMQKLDAQLLRKYHNDVRAAIVAYSVGEKEFDPVYKKFGAAFDKHLDMLPKNHQAQARNYLKDWDKQVKITITNATGANVNVSMSGLAH